MGFKLTCDVKDCNNEVAMPAGHMHSGDYPLGWATISKTEQVVEDHNPKGVAMQITAPDGKPFLLQGIEVSGPAPTFTRLVQFTCCPKHALPVSKSNADNNAGAGALSPAELADLGITT